MYEQTWFQSWPCAILTTFLQQKPLKIYPEKKRAIFKIIEELNLRACCVEYEFCLHNDTDYLFQGQTLKGVKNE